MKTLLFLAALALLLPTLSASAGETAHPWEVLVVDKDPKGTNVREAPSGRVVTSIPFQGRDTVRLVKLTGQAGSWFSVAIDGTSGWMHGSVLGTCATGTEDGAPSLSKSPDSSSPATAKIPAGAPVQVLGMHQEWLQVRYVDAKGKNHDGWLPEQAVAMSEAEREACATAWAKAWARK